MEGDREGRVIYNGGERVRWEKGGDREGKGIESEGGGVRRDKRSFSLRYDSS